MSCIKIWTVVIELFLKFVYHRRKIIYQENLMFLSSCKYGRQYGSDTTTDQGAFFCRFREIRHGGDFGRRWEHEEKIYIGEAAAWRRWARGEKLQRRTRCKTAPGARGGKLLRRSRLEMAREAGEEKSRREWSRYKTTTESWERKNSVGKIRRYECHFTQQNLKMKLDSIIKQIIACEI